METDKKSGTLALMKELYAKPEDYWTNNGDIDDDGNTCQRFSKTGVFDNATTL